MPGLSALELARIQFGFAVSFHIIFPAITIGLASYLAVLESLWLWRNDTVYRDLYHFWSKIFVATAQHQAIIAIGRVVRRQAFVMSYSDVLFILGPGLVPSLLATLLKKGAGSAAGAH